MSRAAGPRLSVVHPLIGPASRDLVSGIVAAQGNDWEEFDEEDFDDDFDDDFEEEDEELSEEDDAVEPVPGNGQFADRDEPEPSEEEFEE